MVNTGYSSYDNYTNSFDVVEDGDYLVYILKEPCRLDQFVFEFLGAEEEPITPATLTGITASNYKDTFGADEEFETGKLIVVANYSDGFSKVITGYTVDSSAFKKSVPGTYTIKITYQGKETTYNVTVKANS